MQNSLKQHVFLILHHVITVFLLYKNTQIWNVLILSAGIWLIAQDWSRLFICCPMIHLTALIDILMTLLWEKLVILCKTSTWKSTNLWWNYLKKQQSGYFLNIFLESLFKRCIFPQNLPHYLERMHIVTNRLKDLDAVQVKWKTGTRCRPLHWLGNVFGWY